MILFYFIIVPILVWIIWLIVQRKWKMLLWSTGILVVLIIVGWFLLLNFVSVAFSNKCEVEKSWKIEGYEIVEKHCIGYAGPSWYPIYLYRDNIEIDYVNSRKDSCVVKFTNEIGEILEFNLCKEIMN